MSPDAPIRIVRCPLCRAEAVAAYRPFCSKRCADIDLGKWFVGGYAIAGRSEDEDGEPAPEGDGDLPEAEEKD